MLRLFYTVEEYRLERFVAAHLLGGPGGEQLAATDDGHLVAKLLNYLEHVRREKDRAAAGSELAEHELELVRGNRIEAYEGLIEHEEPGFVQERADEHEFLTHAVRIASHRIAKGAHKLKALGKLGDALGAYIGRDLEDVGKVGEVLDSRHEFVDVGIVGNIGDEALCGHGVARNVDAAHADAAPVDALHAHDRADKGGLASAVMADEAVDVTRLYFE